MDSMAQATLEIEAAVRTRAVIDTIESTLGIKIGPTEITEAALSLSAEEKIKLAATLWESAMPPMTEPTAGVYVLSAREKNTVMAAISLWLGLAADKVENPNCLSKVEILDFCERLQAGDQF